MVAVAMGEHGAISRILGVRAGSAFTFGAASVAEATAPGQLDVRTLRDLFRVDQLRASKRIYGVAGNPLHSSLSPLMLNTAFQRTHQHAVYVPLLSAEAEEVLHVARTLPLAGFSVTMPLKQAIVPFLDRLDPLAARIGAVNTVVCEPDGTLCGYNTDAAGIT